MNDNTSWIGKWIVYLGLGLAYLKTSEALVPYAPRGVFGWQSDWIGYIWAYLCGALVEGVLYVAYTKLRERGKDRPTMVLAGFIAVVSVAFSVTMNRIDQMVTDGVALELASGNPLAVLHNVVFLIPLFAAVLFMVLEAVDNKIDNHQFQRPKSFKQGPQPERRPQMSEFGRGPDFAREHMLPKVEVAELAGDPLGQSLLGAAPSPNGQRKFTSEAPKGPRLSLME